MTPFVLIWKFLFSFLVHVYTFSFAGIENRLSNTSSFAMLKDVLMFSMPLIAYSYGMSLIINSVIYSACMQFLMRNLRLCFTCHIYEYHRLLTWINNEFDFNIIFHRSKIHVQRIYSTRQVHQHVSRGFWHDFK